MSSAFSEWRDDFLARAAEGVLEMGRCVTVTGGVVAAIGVCWVCTASLGPVGFLIGIVLAVPSYFVGMIAVPVGLYLACVIALLCGVLALCWGAYLLLGTIVRMVFA